MKGVTLHCGDCLDVLPTLPECSVDAIVTDPPYGLQFMGKHWDHGVPGVAFGAAMLRVLKPGGHLLAFGGTRTYHRMACAIEDAGFEIRDQIQWLYGSGFPKSHDVSKVIDRAAGAAPKIVGEKKIWGSNAEGGRGGQYANGIAPPASGQSRFIPIMELATEAARQWQGWGTALKPANEPICLARKPLSEKTVAANVLRWGTGALNINGCRIFTDEDTARTPSPLKSGAIGYLRDDAPSFGGNGSPLGRWPANVLHDGSDEVLDLFPEQKSPATYNRSSSAKSGHFSGPVPKGETAIGFGDQGSAARFFYTAKADKAERADSKHPTVKPLSLMRYLCRLIVPPGGVVLDPFAGTGTVGEAAIREGFRAVLIERETEYQADIRRRISLARRPVTLVARCSEFDTDVEVSGQLLLPLMDADVSDMG